MQQSEQINELGTALAKAQGAITFAAKSSENPFFKSRYADLASVWEAVRKPLSDNGLSISQGAEFLDDVSRVAVDTILIHSSGQWIKSRLTLPTEKSSPQAVGSAITYARRYSLASIVGVAQDDDDAEGAMKRPNGNAHAPQKHSAARPPAPQTAKPRVWEEFTESEKIAASEKRIEASRGNYTALQGILEKMTPEVMRGISEENCKYLLSKLDEAMKDCEALQDIP